jgi:hypothetical protein
MVYFNKTTGRDFPGGCHVAPLDGSVISIILLIRIYKTTVHYEGPSWRAVGGIVLGRFDTGIVGSNPARGMHACLCISVLCCPV